LSRRKQVAVVLGFLVGTLCLWWALTSDDEVHRTDSPPESSTRKAGARAPDTRRPDSSSSGGISRVAGDAKSGVADPGDAVANRTDPIIAPARSIPLLFCGRAEDAFGAPTDWRDVWLEALSREGLATVHDRVDAVLSDNNRNTIGARGSALLLYRAVVEFRLGRIADAERSLVAAAAEVDAVPRALMVPLSFDGTSDVRSQVWPMYGRINPMSESIESRVGSPYELAPTFSRMLFSWPDDSSIPSKAQFRGWLFGLAVVDDRETAEIAASAALWISLLYYSQSLEFDLDYHLGRLNSEGEYLLSRLRDARQPGTRRHETDSRTIASVLVIEKHGGSSNPKLQRLVACAKLLLGVGE